MLFVVLSVEAEIMKFQVTMKDADTLHDSIVEAVAGTVGDMPEDEKEVIMEIRIEKAENVARKWFQYGEFLTVEIDTEAKTRVVLEVKR